VKLTQRGAQTAFGGIPRVDLLPPEVKEGQRAVRRRSWMAVGVIAALGLTAGAYVISLSVATSAQAALEREQGRSIELLDAQAEFSEVRTVTQTAELITAAQQVGALTEIQWRPFIGAVQATLPSGVTIVEFSINSASPTLSLPQPESPLLAARAATIVFTAESPDLPNVRAWLDNLTQILGYTDATPGAVRLNEDTGFYEATITMGVSDQARSGRFAPIDDAGSPDANDQDEQEG